MSKNSKNQKSPYGVHAVIYGVFVIVGAFALYTCNDLLQYVAVSVVDCALLVATIFFVLKAKEVERQAQESQQWKNALQNAPIGLVLLDDSSRCLFVNDCGQNEWKIVAGDVLGLGGRDRIKIRGKDVAGKVATLPNGWNSQSTKICTLEREVAFEREVKPQTTSLTVKPHGEELAEISRRSENCRLESKRIQEELERFSKMLIDAEGKGKEAEADFKKASQLTNDNDASLNHGFERMEYLVESMNAIQRSSQQITNIIKVIDDIAFQTNLLALNAAVEAARAGRYGKGFAVVASEVRSLAGRSARAAKETSELIEKGSKSIEEGAKIANDTTVSMKKILETALNSKGVFGSLMSTNQAQVSTIEQIQAALQSFSRSAKTLDDNIDDVVKRIAKIAGGELPTSAPKSQKTAETKVVEAAHLFAPKDVAKNPPQSEIKNPITKAPVPQKAQESWGRIPPKYQKQFERGESVRPEEIIALDDKEFAKYG